MLSVKGTYKDGMVILREKFSFKKARKLLETYEGSLSEAIIEERRSAV